VLRRSLLALACDRPERVDPRKLAATAELTLASVRVALAGR
jgi:hypothetical protein